jgi:succinate-semialdehyde dehydrogenase/glutarate-semialdehyde dehydrogenase
MNETTSIFPQYIDGHFRPGRGDRAQPVTDPATGRSHGEIAHAGEADVAEAIAAATRTFPAWRKTSPLARGSILRDTAGLMRARRDAIAHAIATELGKPLAEAVREVDTAAEMFDWSAEEARRSYGRVIPARGAGISQVAQPEPIGPVAAFSGWNAPAITPSRKIAGALAAGCTIVIKPSEETPGVALAIARAAADAGLPPGVLNMVFGDPGRIADQLLESADIRMVTFTGATAIGKQVGEKAARTMKRATLELGGHAPVIVMPDVDVEAIARSAVATKFRNAGQVCTSPTRFYVHERVYERFAQAFAEATRGLRVGNPLDKATQMGPLKNARRRDAVERLIDDARSQGVAVLAGGSRMDGPGFFHQPTVLGGFTDACRAANEEPFGPVALLRPFETIDQAIAEANRLPFGLAAYVFTRDLMDARRLSEEIDSGVVCINDWQASLPETPFGGFKDSGLGSEGGVEGLREFQRTKCVRQGSTV